MHILRPKRSGLSIDMTPMIDVVFQLLIFFMLSSSFLTPSIRLLLPKAVTGDNRLTPRLIVSVDKSGQIFLNTERIDSEALQTVLESRLGEDPQRAVCVRGDEEMPYRLFVEVVDAARRAGARQINVLHQGRPQ
ncbi:MAG: biopolymer transporter ExbD [Planctomycetes bacterium]|nr:biopolymer transporter ExbD [Planctomycetota bacterium]